MDLPLQVQRSSASRALALPAEWDAVAAAFLDDVAMRGGSERTAIEYGRILRRLFIEYGPPPRIDPLTVHRFAFGPGPSGAAPARSTICVRLAAIARFFDFARRLGLSWRDPSAGLRRPRPASPVARGLATADIRHLLAAIPDTPIGRRDRAIAVLILLTGLRRAEALALTVGDIDLPERMCRVRVKGGRERLLRLPEPAARLLEPLLAGRGPAEPAFGIGPAAFYANLRRYAGAAGVAGVTPHALRHTAAALRRQTGASLEAVSTLLGHASLVTTARYLRRLEPEVDAGWQPVAELLGIEGGKRSEGRALSRAGPIHQTRPGRCANTFPATRDRRAVKCSPIKWGL